MTTREEILAEIHRLEKPLKPIHYKYRPGDIVQITEGDGRGQCYIIQDFAWDGPDTYKERTYVIADYNYQFLTIREDEIILTKSAKEIGMKNYHKIHLERLKQLGYQIITD